MIRTLKEFKIIKSENKLKRDKSSNKTLKNSTIVGNNEFNSQNSQYSKEIKETNSKINENKYLILNQNYKF